jgi:hypothetical protein
MLQTAANDVYLSGRGNYTLSVMYHRKIEVHYKNKVPGLLVCGEAGNSEPAEGSEQQARFSLSSQPRGTTCPPR